MARILLATFGSYGDVNPTLVLGRALRARGHEAVVATLPGFRGDIEGAGLGFVPMGPDIDPEDTALIRRVMDPRTGSEAVVRELVLPGLRDATPSSRRPPPGPTSSSPTSSPSRSRSSRRSAPINWPRAT